VVSSFKASSEESDYLWVTVPESTRDQSIRNNTAQPIRMESDSSTTAEFKDLLHNFKDLSLDSVSESPIHPQAPRSVNQWSNQIHGRIHQTTKDQLADDVKNIYTSLVIAENQCDDTRQSTPPAEMTGDQWETHHTLHEKFLHCCIDLIYTSNHPTASDLVKETPQRHDIVKRLWDNGIYSALELLREGGSSSSTHLSKFWNTAYELILLLLEKCPHFKGIWLERLGDLVQYRMLVDTQTQEACLAIASSWYSRAADLNPEIGRYQHHLATIAQPKPLKQLFHFFKALISVQPFASRQDIHLFFGQFWDPTQTAIKKYPSVLTSFIKAHSLLFIKRDTVEFIGLASGFLTELDTHISIAGLHFREQGIYILASNYAAILDHSHNDAGIPSMFQQPGLTLHEAYRYWQVPPRLQIGIEHRIVGFSSSSHMVSMASHFAFATLDVIVRHSGNSSSLWNIMPSVHLSLAFLWCMAVVPEGMLQIHADVPWERIAMSLNILQELDKSEELSTQEPESHQQLPEDHLIRGFSWSQMYYPQNHFNGMAEGDGRWIDLPSMTAHRIKRCLWLGEELVKVS
jgi:hypothetical protein